MRELSSSLDSNLRNRGLALNRLHITVLNLLLDGPHIDVRDSVLAIEDLGDLLQRRALGLDVEEVDEDELDADPERVEERQVPVVRQVLPGDGAEGAKSAWRL